MPRRTALDTIFDNENVPSAEDLATAAELETAAADPLDDEDYNQLVEGHPGDLGSGDDNPKVIVNNDTTEEMDPEEYQNAISKAIGNAEDFIDMELSPDRELAAKYYRGEPFGNEVENRSQVVMTEVRDTILSVMPPLLRVFCGTTEAVEFINNEGTPEEQAKAQTGYINHIVHKDNEGFTIFYSAFKDALTRKTGVFTWWHEEKETVTQEILTGLNEKAYALLVLEKQEASSEDERISYEITILSEKEDTTAPGEVPDLLDDAAQVEDAGAEGILPDEMALMGQAVTPDVIEPPKNFIRDVKVVARTIKKRHRVAAVPPEEFICTPISSSDLDEFPLVGRRQMKTIGELVALGHDEDEIREAIGGSGGQDSTLTTNAEVIDRNGAAVDRIFHTGFDAVDEMSEYVKYCCVYVLIDKDGDGILERRKICTVGDNNAIIYDEIVDEMVPFALVCPDPEPHSPFGYSLADQTMDFQEVKSEIVRGVLDSLAESIVGRTAIVEGKVNIDDALSNDRDQLIRTKEVGAIWSLSKPFSGMNAIPVLEYMDNVKARRTGVTMAPAGLKADTLQSTSTDAVNAVVDASQERAEMIARIFAETGIKRLMRGLLQNVVRHQDQKRMIRLRGRPITVDPRSFVADLDLEVNVGLGRGTADKRMQGLTLVLSQQKEVYKEFGPGNILVGLHHISNTVEDLIREVGFNDVSRYMNIIDKAANDAFVKQQASKPPQPTPEELLFKANVMKIQSDADAKRRADMIKVVLALMADDQARDKAEMDYYTKAAELLGKFGIETSEQEMRAHMEEQRQAAGMADGAINHGQQAVQQISGPAQEAQAQ